MEDEFISIVKGALLHDIGKIIQRAQDIPTSKKHTELGYDWLKEHMNGDIASVAAIAHYWTNGVDIAFKNNFNLIWYHANNLSLNGRIELENLDEVDWHSEIGITSPFSMINNPNKVSENAPLAFLPLTQLKNVDEVLKDEPSCSKEDYKELLRNFEDDFNSATLRPYSIDFLLMLFEKHFSRTPSISLKLYGGLKKEDIKDDTSLYDHSKLTAAIAGCMYHYYRQTYHDKWDKNELLKEEILNVAEGIKPYMLISGDISGIQKFIYTITSKGALKSLKGRSFFLELLSEHIVSELLQELKLTRCNLIFSGGGHFYILAYNTPLAGTAITKIKKNIDEYLFNEFRGNLQLNIALEPFHPEAFKDSSPIWTGLFENLEVSKKTKWQDKLNEIIKVEMPHEDCLTENCNICFREDIPLKEHSIGDDVLNICESCISQYQLGEMLKSISQEEYAVLYKLATKPDGKYIKVADAYYQLKHGRDKSLHLSALAVYRINDFTAKHYFHQNSLYLPIGIYQCDKLQELSDASSAFGINRIAVLRMDVDNLGKIFSQAIPEERRTFSRLASISRGLNKFFKVDLNIIVEGKKIDHQTNIADRNLPEKGRMLTIVYSGGDDLFLIGNWLDITEVAFDINNYFKRYTGNPFLKISGGIAVNHDKYPVYQYAHDAEDAEYLSKKGTKNAITLFGNRVFKWDEAEKVLERVRLFTRFLMHKDDCLAVDEEKLPKTFFYRLLALSRRFIEDGVLILPKAAYLLSRIKFGNCNALDILKLKEVIMNNSVENWKITEVATMWTLMLTRRGGDENVGK